ncbi:MAG: sigma-54 dependent transcriptional regulator, partial [Desulfobacteraceae bacterium]
MMKVKRERFKENVSHKKILIIDDEENMRHMLSKLLLKNGYQVEDAADGVQGLKAIEAYPFKVILCDVKMPDMGGLEFLKAAGESIKNSMVIMMSAYGNIDMAVEAMKLGAFDFISKPFKNDEILLVIQKAEEHFRLKCENRQLQEKLNAIEQQFSFGEMVAKSECMQRVFELALKVAHFNTTVLITGESGTGKELVAKGIHYAGGRREKPMIPVNCGGIPENLMESELFGHLKGAFTGADRNKKGLFEEANQGTIFLDEIGELTQTLQVKLLRVLQENEIRPIGASTPSKVDVRVIAATSRHLSEEIKSGNFREDLYYRLNVMTIKLPPLRDRTADISLLCRYFIQRFNASLGCDVKNIAPTAMKQLMAYPWPGNVRELENAIERAMVLTEGNTLEESDFPENIMAANTMTQGNDLFKGHSLKQAQKVLEKE